MYLSFADIIHEEDDELAEIPVFLDVEKLISIALKTKCDALHPGYGFLAENAYFAEKCRDNGSPSSVLHLMPFTRWATSPSPGRSPCAQNTHGNGFSRQRRQRG
jgi:hypothetical protein